MKFIKTMMFAAAFMFGGNAMAQATGGAAGGLGAAGTTATLTTIGIAVTTAVIIGVTIDAATSDDNVGPVQTTASK